MADAGAGVDIVIAKASAHHFLHQIDLFVGAATRRNGANASASILGLNSFKALGGIVDRLVPRDFAPGVVDAIADHRCGDAVFVGRVAEGEAALNAGVALVCLAVFVGCHTHHLIALHLGFKGTANAAVGAGSGDRVFGFSCVDNAFFGECRGRADVHAGATRYAFRVHESVGLTGADLGLKATAVYGQCKGALNLFTGAYAARADNTFRWVKGKIGVGLIFFSV